MKGLVIASCAPVVNYMMWHTFMHDLFYVFIEQTSNFFFNLRNNSNLLLKYPQVQWGLCIGGRCSHSQAKFHWLFFLFFSFLFQDLISLGLRGQIIPENLRLLLVWYIQVPNCPGYFYRFLWIEISVDMLFSRLSAFFLSTFFIFCAHFSLPKLYSFSKYLAFTFSFVLWEFKS